MSFKYRFIIAFVTLEAFFIILIVGVNFFTIDSTSKNQMDQQLKSLKLLMSDLVKAPMSVYDLATLDNIVLNTNTVESIKYVFVVDNQNRVISSNYDKKILSLDIINSINEDKTISVSGKTYKFLFKEVFTDDIKLGHIHLIVDITDSIEAIQTNKKNTYSIIFFEILISTILAFFIGQRLTRNLLDLKSSAEKIGNNEIVKIPHLDKKSEIGVLANAINTMQNDIQQRNKELSLYEKIFSNTQEGICITDEEGQILIVNNAFASMSGYSQDELIGNNTRVLKSGVHDNTFYKNLWVEILKNGIWHGEIVNRNKEGKLYTVLLNISSIKDASSKIINFIAISSDISLLKEKERVFQSQAKMTSMGEMLNNIAHQWRQPLSTISTLASGVLLQKEFNTLKDDDLVNSLDKVILSCGYLSNTIEDFRNFFRNDKQAVKIVLDDMIKNDLTIIKPVLKENNINLVLNLEDGVIINSYKNELLQAFVNIINNSKDAMLDREEDHYIFIDLKNYEQKVSISIKDSGGGVEESIIENIFDPYFTTKHQSYGTGIGLYMTHTILVDHMHGEITLNNVNYEYKGSSYKGLEFKVILPKEIIT